MDKLLKDIDILCDKCIELDKDQRLNNYNITLDDMEEFYNNYCSKFSKAYLEGSMFYIGHDFKKYICELQKKMKYKQNQKLISCFIILSIINNL